MADSEQRENLKTCLAGSYPSLCKHGLLSSAEANEVDAAERRENLKTCLSGLFPSLCNHPLLSSTESAQAERQPGGDPPSVSAVRAPIVGGVAENGSYYGEPNANGVPKTVYVNGYYRKDGTYVRGYYRSVPNSNPPKVRKL